ncbi:MAG: sigma-70 family RNA polymerase sigma factor [Chitinophagaceae bacterium]
MQKNLNNLLDEELVKMHRASKSPEIIGILYKRYAHLILGVCIKYVKDADLAKDLVMQIFEKLLNDLHKHDISFFKAWLYRVAQNHCLMYLRSNKHLTNSDIEMDEINMEFDDQIHPKEEKELQYNKMEKALDALNTEQKKCVTLFYIEEKSYQEIIEITGYTYLQVKSHLQNGKRNLKILMERTSLNE